ncbi:hypothetical protein OO015_12195 [Thermomicrobium sp. 4228-Ro]|uniref:hypothetical protein n=1 Tax=Thermomicrobium sp. 4228-Ro TaxID=2993937 RepID=UPI002248F09D|nr:hypothetical protein [Thermomicrobium sp. 4228-Ro]MCX2728251.1 hypothetical protein [Thermomicrobium sp. 4228-Ro]
MTRASLLLACTLALFTALWPVSLRAEEAVRPTAILIDAPASVPVGEQFRVIARLTGPNGELYGAVANDVLQLLVDGVHTRRARTNFAGAVQFLLTDTLPVGRHTLTVVYSGSRSLAPAAASTTITIAPAVLEIQTVPALPGVLVEASGEQYYTGANGTVTIPFDEPGSYQITVSRSVVTPSLHAAFARWNDDSFAATRTILVPKHRILQAGYDTETTIHYRFVDLDGRPVDPGRIERIVLKSSIGEVRELPVAGNTDTSQLVQASRAIPTHAGLAVSPVQWSIEAVTMHGMNVVNRRQQRFYPLEAQDWTITLLLYSAEFTVRDTFLGRPVGRAVRLIYPDGTSEVVPLTAGRGIAKSLPRGDYRIEAIGIFGWSPRAPLALSRNQSVDLTVISGVDILLVLVLVLSSVVALVLAGRPQLGYLRHRLAPARQSSDATPAREHRVRRIALLVALTLTLSGTILLTQGLTRSERPRPAAPTASQPVLTTPPPPASVPAATVRPETTPSPTPIMLDPAPEFADFWERNGGLATFGAPIGPARWAHAEDGTTVLVQDFALARLEYRPDATPGPFVIQLARLGAYEAHALGLDTTPPFQPRSADAPPAADCTYFTQTGHWLCGKFRAFWRSVGLDLGDPDISVRESLALLGYPISEAFVDDSGRTVQYFERAKLVSYPEFHGTPNEVIRDPFVRRPS